MVDGGWWMVLTKIRGLNPSRLGGLLRGVNTVPTVQAVNCQLSTVNCQLFKLHLANSAVEYIAIVTPAIRAQFRLN